MLIAIFWFVEAFASKGSNPLWWLTLLSAFIMLGMGIWVGSQGLLSKGITLLIFAGFWAIMHGVGDFVRAFQLKKLGALVEARRLTRRRSVTPVVRQSAWVRLDSTAGHRG